jgi:hypothetical protein
VVTRVTIYDELVLGEHQVLRGRGDGA